MESGLPVIDITSLSAASEIKSACIRYGFFCIINHGVPLDLQDDLVRLSADFFKQDVKEKQKILMKYQGSAWRGYFNLGDELTSGAPDRKEGIYFGAHQPNEHDRLLHGPNVYPNPDFEKVVTKYMEHMLRVGATLMDLIAQSLGQTGGFDFMRNPTTLFRIFNYPPGGSEEWGVGEHTDDTVSGLQVKHRETGKWLEVPPVRNQLVCNIGDMLEKLTHGLYKSTPHRVKNASSQPRMSFPYFLDPNFDAVIEPIDIHETVADPSVLDRWDAANPREFGGKYGEYLTAKVRKVFPHLFDAVTTSEKRIDT